MSSQEKSLYKQVVVKGNTRPDYGAGTKAYRGFSTVNETASSFVLYDIELIKQDIINHFHIRQGEKLDDPTFGTIIWDVLFEPLTEQLKESIIENVEDIVNADPRVQVNNLTVDQYESGIQVEVTLLFLPYNISEKMRFDFDERAGLLSA